MTDNELLEKLREYAEWAEAHEYAVPIDLSDTLLAAAEKIVELDLENERLTAQCDHLREGAEMMPRSGSRSISCPDEN